MSSNSKISETSEASKRYGSSHFQKRNLQKLSSLAEKDIEKEVKGLRKAVLTKLPVGVKLPIKAPAIIGRRS
jgi:hypothetical protein